MAISLRKILAGMAGAVLLSAPTLGHAEMRVTYQDGGTPLFHISAPDFWSVRAGGPRQLTAPGSDVTRDVARIIGLEPTADPHVWMGFVSPRAVSTFAQAEAYLRAIGPELVKNAELGESKSMTIAGRPAKTVQGTGRRNGRNVTFNATVIDLPGARMAVAVTVFEAGVNPDLVNDVNAVFASFRAAK